MRVLTVPNWSFGRNRTLLRRFGDVLCRTDLRVHYLHGDVDHNRTVSAFSGEEHAVAEGLIHLCELAFDAIDLNKHVGVHPRIGALDVCPIVAVGQGARTDGAVHHLNAFVERVASSISGKFALPVFLYEKSERGRHEADLPSLRKGGFGGLLDRELHPDFGPSRANPRLGVTVMGVRDFLLAVNVNLRAEDPSTARALARDIRHLRAEGDPRFLGVRALGFTLDSRHLTQVSLTVTLPDLTAVDPMIDWIIAEAAKRDVRTAGTELIGVIRPQDLAGATRLSVREEQVVDIAS